MSGLDPVVDGALRAGLGLLFAAAALHKLRDLPGFAATLGDYRLLPRLLLAPAAVALVLAEAGAAALLLAAPRPLGAGVALALLALYSAAIGWNLARGRRHIDCGCLGPAGRQTLSAWLLLRNGVLGLAALLALAEPSGRATSWIDALSLLGSVTLLAMSWNAAHRLAALAPATPRGATGRSA